MNYNISAVDCASDNILSAEERLRAGRLNPVGWGALNWDGKRIVMGERPLIEHPIEPRMKGYRDLSMLVLMCEMHGKYKSARKS